MKKLLQYGVVLSVALLVFSTMAYAAKGTNVTTKTGEVTAAGMGVSTSALAADLAAYARTNENATAMMVAAQLLREANPQDEKRDKQVEGDAVADSGEKAGALVTRENLLAEAKELAGDDLQLVAMIDAESKAQGTKGAVGGPKRTVERVNARSTDTYTVNFRGGERAEVAVIGDGDNDLDLFIYDEYGNLIDSDEDNTDRCYTSWTPRWTGPFTIKVKNYGRSVYSEYVIMTN